VSPEKPAGSPFQAQFLQLGQHLLPQVANRAPELLDSLRTAHQAGKADFCSHAPIRGHEHDDWRGGKACDAAGQAKSLRTQQLAELKPAGNIPASLGPSTRPRVSPLSFNMAAHKVDICCLSCTRTFKFVSVLASGPR